MAHSGLNKYKDLLRGLLPKGWAWEAKGNPESVFYKLIESLANEFARLDERGDQFINDLYPDNTLLMLEDWERLLGLPDECDPGTATTIQERRNRIIQLLTTRGGQNKDFFKTLAANFGYDIGVIDVSDQPPFRAGQGRAGDRLTNGTWRYAFVVTAPADSVVRFRAGQSRAGDRLLVVQNDTLECLLNKYKPAHSIVLFSFGTF